MAFCPECNGVMEATAIECPHCGYDFQSASVKAVPKREGIAYSPLADMALVISMISAALGCIGTVVGCIWSLFQGEFLFAFIAWPIAFFLHLGMLVVFLRVQQDSL